jgi:hypothetical protein
MDTHHRVDAVMLSNSALEQAASAARPWQAAQGKTQARGGPRPVPRPPLLTAGVRKHVGHRGFVEGRISDLRSR